MSECLKCHSQSTTFKVGFSKKTGKKWAAYACDDCKEMNWVQQGQAKDSYVKTQPQAQNSPLNGSVEKKLDLILAILKQNFPPLAQVSDETQEETTPF